MICTLCPDGFERCTRCGARFCVEHAPMPGELCNPCELVYHERKSEIRMLPWFALGFALPWIFLLGIYEHLPSWSARSGGVRAITTGVPMLDVLIMATVTAIFLGKGAMGLRVLYLRTKFTAPPPNPHIAR